MVLVSATRLRVKSPRFLPVFAWHVLSSTWQIMNTPGFLGGRLMREASRAFWTLTLWSDRLAMQHYRNSGAHRQTMSRLQRWCDEAAVVHWEQADSSLPDWVNVHHLIVTDGHPTKLAQPSSAHLKRDIPMPVTQNKGLLLRPWKKHIS